jgi:hypothetical protein
MRVLAGVAVLVLAGCGGGDFSGPAAATPMGCTPGEQVECSCAGGAKSVQTCSDDGASFGACGCDGDGGASDGSDTSGCVFQGIDNETCPTLAPKNLYVCHGSSPERRGCISPDATKPDVFCCK